MRAREHAPTRIACFETLLEGRVETDDKYHRQIVAIALFDEWMSGVSAYLKAAVTPAPK